MEVEFLNFLRAALSRDHCRERRASERVAKAIRSDVYNRGETSDVADEAKDIIVNRANECRCCC